MSIPLNVNGIVYDYPETDDQDWGPDATDWASAVTTGMLQKAGGLFQLLAEADFGSAFGLKSLYYKSRTANPADAGQIRFARADVLNWRNQANSANLSLGVSASDVLQFNGVDIQSSLSVSDTATIDLTLASNVLSAAIVAGSITNAMINAAAAIAYSKLNLAASIANSDLVVMAESTIKGRAAGAGTGAPVDLTATQATAILNNFVGDSGAGGTKGLVPAPAAGDAAAQKFLFSDGTWATPPGAGDVVGPASSTDSGFARFDGVTGKLLKDSAATIANADVAAAAAIAVNKLAALTAARAVVSDGSGFLAVATTTAAEVEFVNGVTSSIQTQIDGKEPTITVLSLAKGGTNKNMAAVAGGVVYTDADSMEVTAAGTTGQVLLSNGSSPPAFGDPTQAATQAQQETGSATDVYVSPGVQQYHASASKAWVHYTTITTTTILASYNITSLTDNGAGNTTVNIATDFSSANFSAVATSNDNGSAAGCLALKLSQTVGTVLILTITPSTLAAADASLVGVAMFGDQA